MPKKTVKMRVVAIEIADNPRGMRAYVKAILDRSEKRASAQDNAEASRTVQDKDSSSIAHSRRRARAN